MSIHMPYHDDPVGFARNVLHIHPTSTQCEILEALVPTNARVSARGGHKSAKTMTLAIAALWFRETRENARVVCLAPTHRQLESVLFSEMKALAQRANLRGLGAGEIIGASTSDYQTIQGLAGDTLFLGDEASGIDDPMWELVEAYAGRVLMVSTPNRTEGYFHRSHHEDKARWACFHLSGFDAAASNIPGLATNEWLHQMREAYQETSHVYRIRCLGQF